MRLPRTFQRQLVPFGICAACVVVLLVLDTTYASHTSGLWYRVKTALENPLSGSHADKDLLMFVFFDSLAAYLFVLLIVLVSYRYLYNVKMLLAGFLFLMTGIFNLVYFLTLNDLPPAQRQQFHILLYLLYTVDLLMVGISPSHLPKVAAQILLASLFMAKAVVVAWASWHLIEYKGIMLASALRSPLLFLALNILAIGAAMRHSATEEVYYGGATAGLSLVLGVAYVARHDPPQILEILLVFSLPIMLGLFVGLNLFVSIGHRIHYDPLVKIYNRGYCDSIVAGKERSLGGRYCVALFDIDHFKAVNDRYGHMVGDSVLYHVGQKIRDIVVPRGIACRYGGEEVIVFFPDSALDQVKKLAREVVHAVERLRIPLKGKTKGGHCKVTISGGLACGSNGHKDIEDVIEAADKALYRSKQAGRNRLTVSRKV